jgi:N-acetylglutamate synthase-like GNAT family acetyltransferase
MEAAKNIEEITVRSFVASDYADIKAWFEKHRFSVLPEWALKHNALISEIGDQKLAMAALYMDRLAHFAHLTWVTVNPFAPREYRSSGITAVIQAGIEKAKENGIRTLFSCTNHERLRDRYLDHGFIITDQQSTEMIYRGGT